MAMENRKLSFGDISNASCRPHLYQVIFSLMIMYGFDNLGTQSNP